MGNKQCLKCHVKDCPRNEKYCNAPIMEYCNKLVHNEQTGEKWEEEIIEKLSMAITHSKQGTYSKNEEFVRDLISTIVANAVEKRDEEIKNQIGFMRQWLNEDRITDVKNLVTNEELLTWLIKSKLGIN